MVCGGVAKGVCSCSRVGETNRCRHVVVFGGPAICSTESLHVGVLDTREDSSIWRGSGSRRRRSGRSSSSRENAGGSSSSSRGYGCVCAWGGGLLLLQAGESEIPCFVQGAMYASPAAAEVAQEGIPKRKGKPEGRGETRWGGAPATAAIVNRDQRTALRAVQDPSMTPTKRPLKQK